jgi:hypothetical protein
MAANFGDILADGGDSVAPDLAALCATDRLLATANGNLQRLVSAFTNKPVEVLVIRNHRNEQSPSSAAAASFDRAVHLLLDGEIFCLATSTVTLSDTRLLDAVESKQVGLGQLFRRFDLLPKFVLRSCEQAAAGGLVRQYSLSAAGIICDITERFSHPCPLAASMLVQHSSSKCTITSTSGNVHHAGVGDAEPRGLCSAPKHLGDLMSSGLRSSAMVEGAFTPLERVLLTAAGNVVRLASAWCNKRVLVSSSEQPQPHTDNNGYALHVADGVDRDDAGGVPAVSRRWARTTTLRFAKGKEEGGDALTPAQKEEGGDALTPAQTEEGKKEEGQLFCTARSIVDVTGSRLADAVLSGVVDTGKLFELLGVLPQFELYEAGRRPCGGLWRRYALWAESTNVVTAGSGHGGMDVPDVCAVGGSGSATAAVSAPVAMPVQPATGAAVHKLHRVRVMITEEFEAGVMQ